MSSVHKSERSEAKTLFVAQAYKVKEITMTKTKHFPRHLWPSVVANMILNTTNAKKYCMNADKIDICKTNNLEAAYRHKMKLLESAREIYQNLDEEIDDYVGLGKMGYDYMYEWHVEIQKEISLLNKLLQSEYKKFKKISFKNNFIGSVL